MRLLHADADRLTFHLSAAERALLLELVERYPSVPPAHLRQRAVAADDPEAAEVQRLLDEALAEQRASTRQQIRQLLLSNPNTFQRRSDGWALHLRPEEFETLLQVLNDVRIGSWIALGCPDPLPDRLPSDLERARHAATMEVAGWLEMSLLLEARRDAAS